MDLRVFPSCSDRSPLQLSKYTGSPDSLVRAKGRVVEEKWVFETWPLVHDALPSRQGRDEKLPENPQSALSRSTSKSAAAGAHRVLSKPEPVVSRRRPDLMAKLSSMAKGPRGGTEFVVQIAEQAWSMFTVGRRAPGSGI